MDWTTLHTYDRACTREVRHSRDVAVDRTQPWRWRGCRLWVGMGMAKPPANNNDRTAAGWGARHSREAISRFDEQFPDRREDDRPDRCRARPPARAQATPAGTHALIIHFLPCLCYSTWGLGHSRPPPRGSSDPITNRSRTTLLLCFVGRRNPAFARKLWRVV